jgi:hypothetical protein
MAASGSLANGRTRPCRWQQHNAQNVSDIELRFTVARLRAAQVELLLLEEEYQDSDFRDVISLLDKIILKIQKGRRF